MKKILLIAITLSLGIVATAQKSPGKITAGKIKLDCTMDVDLTKGYDYVKVFVLDGQRMMFCHNHNTGQTSIWNLEHGGLPRYEKKWSTGWTNIDIYEYKGNVFLFHQKSKDGLARISKLDYSSIMKGESLGPKVYEKKWSSGWTTTKFFVHNDILYFLHYKKGSGLARLNATTATNTVGTKIYEKTWSKGYTNFAMASYANNFFILYQKGDEGTAVINKLELPKLELAAREGVYSPNLGQEVYRKKWSSGWGNAQFFTLNEEVYLFINKPGNGKVHIEKLKASGDLGPRVYERKWSSGWTNIDIFYENGKPQLMHQKSSSGKTKICEFQLD
jgi:hypothetical protein